MTLLSVLALVAGLAAPLAAAAHDGRHAPPTTVRGIEIEGAFALMSGPTAPTAAAYMRITNTTAADERLIGAQSGAAARAELHTHLLEDGIARMRPLPDGIDLPAGATVTLERGGLHVMLMGLADGVAPGGEADLVLEFATAGAIPLVVPVDSSAAQEHAH